MAADNKVRLSADLSADVAEALQELAKEQNITLTEALSRAISTESFLQRKRSSGGKILVDEAGKIKELVFMPSGSRKA
jgi:predicted transcriptional regulator